MLRATALSIVFATGLSGAAFAQAEPTGVWQRDNGASRIRVAACGSNLCGTIIWLKDADGPAKVGQRVIYDMAPNGAGKWSGKAFNPEDGKSYTGTMSLSGGGLTTAGCALGGLVCRSINWRRVN